MVRNQILSWRKEQPTKGWRSYGRGILIHKRGVDSSGYPTAFTSFHARQESLESCQGFRIPFEYVPGSSPKPGTRSNHLNQPERQPVMFIQSFNCGRRYSYYDGRIENG